MLQGCGNFYPAIDPSCLISPGDSSNPYGGSVISKANRTAAFFSQIQKMLPRIFWGIETRCHLRLSTSNLERTCPWQFPLI
jgi:hypothetical protein